MARNIVVIDGHPDPSAERYCHALAEAYVEGARAGGHSASRIALADLDVAVLRTAEDWRSGEPAPDIRDVQQAIAAADHVVIVYPLWLGSMPALLKAFFEQAFRPGFAVKPEMGLRPGLLTAKSARIVVTMGMPASRMIWPLVWNMNATEPELPMLPPSLLKIERTSLTVRVLLSVRPSMIMAVEPGP